MYNLTNVTAGTGFLGFVQGVNHSILGGWAGTLLLIGIGTVFFMGFHKSTGDGSKSLVATSFSLLGISILFRSINLIGNLPLFIILLLLAASLATTWDK